MLRLIPLALALWLIVPMMATAQPLQTILQTHQGEVLQPGRRTVGVVLDDLVASGLPQALPFLEAWRDREIVQRGSDNLFFRAIDDGETVVLRDLDTGDVIGNFNPDDLTEARPNGGVRRAIGDALVQFQLSDADINKRQSAVDAIARSMDASQLAPLVGSIASEPDLFLKQTKTRLAGMLGALFAQTSAARITAIEALSGDLSVDVRAVLNTVLATDPQVAMTRPTDANIAKVLAVGEDITATEAYDRLIAADRAPGRVSGAEIRAALVANIVDGAVVGDIR